MTEQQTHLAQLVDQQNQLLAAINAINNELSLKRELVLKVQGAIEYLTQIGVTLPEEEEDDEEDTEEEDGEE